MAVNPYAPPSAAVKDQSDPLEAGEERLIPGGRSRPAGNGWDWLVGGWYLFKAQPFGWWLSILVGFGLLMALSLIPFVNFVVSIITYPLMAGYGACARSVIHEGRFEINQMFDGFRRHPWSLIALGVLYLLILVVVMLVIMVVMGVGDQFASFVAAEAEMPGGSASMEAIGSIGLLFLIFMLVSMAVASLFLYSPYLIHEHDLGVFAAMGQSIRACLKNIPALLVYTAVMFIAIIIATIPLLLGWLILLPVLYLSIYASYRDIMVQSDEDD